MKTCRRCLREYDEEDPVAGDPAQELGGLFREATEQEDDEGLCPDCRRELGILSLLGFGQ